MDTNKTKMRKIVAIAICLACFSVSNVFAQDNTTDQGVVINGVKWATRNVDKPGTFAEKPESAGMFYQWNRNRAWAATGKNVSGWDGREAEGQSWEKANDPSPDGWRVPTIYEITTLLDTKKVRSIWTVVNGVKGRKYTDKATGNSIFLPAAGMRFFIKGELVEVGSGSYWSSKQQDGGNGVRYLCFNAREENLYVSSNDGINIRCVSGPEKKVQSIVQITEEQIITPNRNDSKQGVSSSTKNENFQDFIQKFKSDSVFQVSRIKFSQIGVSESDWHFWDEKWIFSGYKIIEGQKFIGKFTIHPYKCEYLVGEYQTDFCATFTFSKINGKWYLTKFVNFGEGFDDSGTGDENEIRSVSESKENHIETLTIPENLTDKQETYAQGDIANDPGVVINGVCWATRNVDAPNTFAVNSENTGKIYQWNRKKAWNATGTVSGWDSSTPSGTSWTMANDPCPTGWRIPTFNEIKTLLDINKVNSEWIIINGIEGRRFSDKITGKSIFFPAAGCRPYSDGILLRAGVGGDYWSSTQGSNSSRAYNLSVYSNEVYWYDNDRGNGFCIRCVKVNITESQLKTNSNEITPRIQQSPQTYNTTHFIKIGKAETNYYNGHNYIGMINSTNGFRVTVNSNNAQTVNLSLLYRSDFRGGRLIVNGINQNISFSSTNWNWSVKEVSAQLRQGINTIEFFGGYQTEWAPDIAEITIK